MAKLIGMFVTCATLFIPVILTERVLPSDTAVDSDVIWNIDSLHAFSCSAIILHMDG